MLDVLRGSFLVSFTLWVFVWDPSFMLKSWGVAVGGGGGLQDFSVSPGSESTEPGLLSLSH